MKHTFHFLALLLLIAGSLAAQSGTCTGAGNGTGAGTPALDPATLATYDGTVFSVDIAWGQGTPGVTLLTDEGEASVLLGPIWYMDQNAFTLEAGDLVTVAAFTGSCSGAPCLIAKEVANHTKGTAIVFRTDEGHPLWRGPRAKKFANQQRGPVE